MPYNSADVNMQTVSTGVWAQSLQGSCVSPQCLLVSDALVGLVGHLTSSAELPRDPSHAKQSLDGCLTRAKFQILQRNFQASQGASLSRSWKLHPASTSGSSPSTISGTPVLLSSLHMLTGVVVGRPLARLRAGGSGNPTLGPEAKARVFLLSLTFCASVAFGNLGLNYVQLDFAQMVYTTTPLFTLTLSKVLLGKHHHPLQYAAMGPICLGASLSIIGEVQFDQAGCCFLFAATFLRGLKSIQQSTLLQEEQMDSPTLLCLTSLPSFYILFTAALLLEVGPSWDGTLASGSSLWLCILLSCLGSVLYNLASFCVISLTSALTIHILGNFNVVGNLLLSHMLFGSRLTLLGYAGIALTLLGVFMYHHCDRIASCWRSLDRGAKRD
ncbi:UNVERIFIED_CONTAM: hypothetical protein K2H54_027361 [Gekko kuhli]